MIWDPSEEKKITRYIRRKMSGGRSIFARTLDHVALRALAFVASYLLFAPLFSRRSTALLLASITLALLMLLLHIINDIRYTAFRKREILQVRKQLLLDRLLLLDMQSAILLVSGRCPPNTTPVVLQRVLPIDADALLSLLRTHMYCGELHVFSCSAYDATAKAFAARTNGMLVLHAPEEILSAGIDEKMLPSSEDAIKSILAQSAPHHKRIRRMSGNIFSVRGARKYAVISLLLTGLSFVTSYALYYRLLAGLCMTVAAFGLWGRSFRAEE